MKTQIKIAIAALVLASFAFEGCKKGENDPAISLLTRKARMTGDWKVSSGSGTETSGNTTTTWTHDGATYSETDISGTNSNGLAVTMSFVKDGTYEIVTTITLPNVTGYSDVITETGTWNFTGKIGEDKNKDHILLKTLRETDVMTVNSNVQTTVRSYTGDSAPTKLYYLDQLKSKEVILTWDGTDTYNTLVNTSIGTWTLTQ